MLLYTFRFSVWLFINSIHYGSSYLVYVFFLFVFDNHILSNYFQSFHRLLYRYNLANHTNTLSTPTARTGQVLYKHTRPITKCRHLVLPDSLSFTFIIIHYELKELPFLPNTTHWNCLLHLFIHIYRPCWRWYHSH